MLILNMIPNGVGWDPINHLVALAAELLDAEVIDVSKVRLSRTQQLLSVLSRRRKSAGASESCLLICSGPAELSWIFGVPGWRTRFSFLSAWVIDSFWTHWIPKTVRVSRPFDRIYVTTGEDLSTWTESTGVPVTWLPWGTDALRLGTAGGVREWDLTRVGRQPAEWDDDKVTAAASAALGLRFHPRPDSSGKTPLQNQKALMQLYGRTKHVLAFSNVANPEHYTHQTRSYLTGRWVDALGCGAVVAGMAPKGEYIDRLLWPEATLDLGTTKQSEGLAVLRQAVDRWTPELAQHNFSMALERLDWRWRLQQIAQDAGVQYPRLEAELAQLRQLMAPATAQVQ